MYTKQETDHEYITALRNRVCYNPGYNNSLVEWTLSPEWTDSYTGPWFAEVNGTVYTLSFPVRRVYNGVIVSGEFVARDLSQESELGIYPV